MRQIPTGACLGLLLLLVFLTGCASTPKPGLPPGLQGYTAPPGYEPYFSELEAGGERDWVLNLNTIAVVAMKDGKRDLAKRCLDESILNINAVFGTTPEAVQARSLFFSEDVKLFKGDPYERCLTFLYRGILYMQDGDWENARASFRSGILQDAFAEEEQNRADWTIFDYLIGVCEIQLDRDFFADEAFDRASKVYEDFPANYRLVMNSGIPEAQRRFERAEASHNLLVVAQSGLGPEKIRTGDYGQFLSYRRRVQGVPTSSIQICDLPRTPVPIMDSVSYQAMTRGGRPFDRIQKKKVLFKDVSSKAGDVSLIAGGALILTSDKRDQTLVGLGFIAAGLVLKVVSTLVQPRADIRQWPGAPDTVGVYTGEVCEGTHQLTVVNGSGRSATQEVSIPESGAGLTVVLTFGGDHPAILAATAN